MPPHSSHSTRPTHSHTFSLSLSLSFHFTPFIRPNGNLGSDSTGSTPRVIGLVALAIALPPPSVNELRLESDMFVLRLGLDFKILHVEPRYEASRASTYCFALTFYPPHPHLHPHVNCPFFSPPPSRVTELLDFTPEELVGKSMYSFVYGQDSVQLRKCHVDRKYLCPLPWTK